MVFVYYNVVGAQMKKFTSIVGCSGVDEAHLGAGITQAQKPFRDQAGGIPVGVV